MSELFVITGERLTPDHPDWPFKPEPPVENKLYLPIVDGCYASGNEFQKRHKKECDVYKGGKCRMLYPDGKYRRCGYHPGKDLFRFPKDHGWPDSTGALVCSPMDGEVTKVKWYDNGLWIRIQHDDGIISLSGHCNEKGVKQGQVVEAGEYISSLWGGGDIEGWLAHDHYQIYLPGIGWVDPWKWSQKNGAVVMKMAA